MKMHTNSCPCCGSPLLRHARYSGVYWFCTSCWQEVPLVAVSKKPVLEIISDRLESKQPIKS